MAYTKSTPGIYTFHTTQHDSSNTGAPASVFKSRVDVKWVDTRAGSRVPDWREKIRQGISATSPYTANQSRFIWTEGGSLTSRVASVVSPFHWYLTQQNGIINHTPELPNHISVPATNAVESKALSKIYKKIDAEQTHLAGASVMAEFIDVIRQFGSPARSIIDLTNRRLNRLELERKGLKGSTSFKKIRWSEIVASTYLEYAFGLAPLIGDTKKAAEALARFQIEPELKPRAKVVARESAKVATATPVSGLGVGSTPFVGGKNITTEYRVQYVVGLEATPIAAYGSNERLIQLLGFQPSKWAPALWEAVPWSWLLDYFTNVGQILAAGATCTSGVKWIAKTVSQRSTLEYRTRWNYGHLPTAILNSRYSRSGTHAGSYGSERTTVTRTIPQSLGVPSLYVEHPFNDVKKIANMTAVLFARKPGQSALWIF